MTPDERPAETWSYDKAFSRNDGLLRPEEQETLRRGRVAIVGMGGVGGSHLITLARLGIGGFHIADPDRFEVANFNRQYGATTRALGRPKAEVMAEEALAVNPDLDLRVFGAITPDNVGAFLDGAKVLIDGIDFFEIAVRRLLFREARRHGLWAVTAGPIGFSTAYLSFAPGGMSFDEYFDLNDSMSRVDQLIAFLVGLTPGATHLPYVDLTKVDVAARRGPSAGLSCMLCSGVAAALTLKVLLGRGHLKPAPYYFQFDAFRDLFRRGKLRGGNRHPLQRLKRWVLRRRAERLGWAAALAPDEACPGLAVPVTAP